MVNKVILIGNVGTEPEVRALETGVKMARLRTATTERIYNASTGEKREHTEWHTVVLWRGQADFAEKYIRKGSQVYVEGKIRSREWTEEATGNKRFSVEILADEIRLLGGQRRGDNNNTGDQRTHQQPQTTAGGEGRPAQQGEHPSPPQLPKDADDLPF